MEKIKIEIIQLGQSKFPSEWKFIEKLEENKKYSEIFEIKKIRSIGNNKDIKYSKEMSFTDGDLKNGGYSDDRLLGLIEKSPSVDFSLAFTDYPLDNNYLVRRFPYENKNIAVATFYETSDIFKNANVSLESFILKTIYTSCVLFLMNLDDPNKAFHDKTEGCLFDMCWYKKDIIASCTTPKICSKCETELIEKYSLPIDVIKQIKKEIKRIRRHFYFLIVNWVKTKPKRTFFVATIFSIIISILSSWLYELIRCFLPGITK